MKKTIAILLALLMLGGTMLISCDIGKSSIDMENADKSSDGSGNSSADGGYKVEKDPYELDTDEPYIIEYTSNGDGTCRATSIKMNSAYRNEFILKIPEKSPEGDTVVAIDWGEAFDDVSHAVPKYIVSDIFKTIKDSVSDDPKSTFLFNKLTAYYSYQNPDVQTSEKVIEAMLKTFPVTEYMPIYVLDEIASACDKAELIRTFDKFSNTDIEFKEYYQFYKNLRDLGLSNEKIDEFYGDAPIPQYGNYSTYAIAVMLPASLKSIGEGCFTNFVSDNAIIPENIELSVLQQFMEQTSASMTLCYMGAEKPAEWSEDWKVLTYNENFPADDHYDNNYIWRYDENGFPQSWREFYNETRTK